QEPGRLDMRVRVDQARDDSLALRIQDLGLGAGETANACLIADADDLAILDGDALGERERRIDGNDLGIDDDHVRVESGAVRFRGHARSSPVRDGIATSSPYSPNDFIKSTDYMIRYWRPGRHFMG